MALLAFSLFAAISQAAGQSHENCLPGKWLAAGSEVTFCDEMPMEYDGSLVPDCAEFHGEVNTTSFFHVHEYDCGLFWQCGPEGVCLFDCPKCVPDPITCPEDRLQFDCRYAWPNGPVCAFADSVNCKDCEDICNGLNCPADQTCDPTTDCRCSDCATDADCSGGEVCCDRVCSLECDGGSTTDSSPTTTTTDGTTTDGNSCTKDSDCEGWDAICNHPAYDNCQYCDGEICQAGCTSDDNCAENRPLCTGIHNCGNVGYPGLLQVTVKTFDCTGCSGEAGSEGGLVLELVDNQGLSCTSGGLDNVASVDYAGGNVADFVADKEAGLGGCEYANLNFHITGGAATWTGTGTWAGASKDPICFYFYDETEPFYQIFNCCDLDSVSLEADASAELTNCRVCVTGGDCVPA